MSFANEKHTATIVSIDGARMEIATSSYENDNRDIDSFVDKVAEEIGEDSSAMTAFVEAFNQCEAKDGSVIEAEALFDRGTMLVERRKVA